MSLYSTLLRPALFAIEPEAAHRLAIAALRLGFPPGDRRPDDPRLRVRLAGLDLPGPVGLAAGFDKNGDAPDMPLRLGFGFLEIGTVTPLPQAGNPRPRMFRLGADKAVINRLGFNNDGHGTVLARLRSRRRAAIVGINIGANRDSPDRIGDYVAGIEAFWPVADYFTINVSSPNTPGLRDLQAGATLSELLSRALARRDELTGSTGRRRPLFLKIAPDLDDSAMDGIAEAVRPTSLDGLIVSNTTLSRTGVFAQAGGETGGLSGRPLFVRSTVVLARMRQRLPQLPIIGVGGIDGAGAARAKIEAGADAVQLYTAMIYEGPWLAARIHREFAAMLDREAAAGIAAWKGSRTAEWAGRPIRD